MRVYVGTSGWYYDWNIGKNLDWYLQYSGLNAVELNASFYRFPFPSQVKSWAGKGKNLKWAVKVHRLITHKHRFSAESLKIWVDFFQLFSPLDASVSFYLFQTPASFQEVEKALSFAEETNLGKRFALEFRNLTLLQDTHLCLRLSRSLTLVSVDSPDIQGKIFPAKTVYLRLHGRVHWYSHDYTDQQLQHLAEKLLETKAEEIFVFFNNNHAMLKNARTMYHLLTEGRRL